MTAKKTVTSVAAEISEHEAVCAERYKGLIQRINRMEGCMLASVTLLISGMASLIIRGIN